MKNRAFLLLAFFLMNPAIAHVHTPEDILPSGVDAFVFTNPYTGESGLTRKGTIGATLLNIHALNKLLQNEPTKENNRLIDEIMAENKKLIASLKILGLFNVFSIDEWLANANTQPGRCLLGLLYLQHYPTEMTPNSKATIEDIKKSANPYLKSAAKALTS